MQADIKVFEAIHDNEAGRVLDVRLKDGAAPVVIPYRRALLIGAQDGTGSIVADDSKRARPIPIARGRVDWLGDGALHIGPGGGPFGRALLVEVRDLVKPEGLGRTLGDRVLLENQHIVVYEEILAPSELRPMHHHGPRFVLSVTDINLMTTLPTGEKRPARRDAGYVSWTPAVVTHDVLNIAKEPFWCVCVEGA